MANVRGSRLRHVAEVEAELTNTEPYAGPRRTFAVLTCGHRIDRPWHLGVGQRAFCAQCRRELPETGDDAR